MSEKKLPDEVIEKILKARDALVMNDRDEAYYQLYGIASPQYDKYFPWEEMEKQINYPKLNEEQIKARKDFDGRYQAGAVWMKASEYDISKGGMLFYRFDGPTLKSIGIGHFVGDLFHGVNLDVFPKWDWKNLYILDERTAAGREEVDPQELWDEFSEYIDNDIDSCQNVAGSSIMTEASFKKAFAKFKQKEK